VNCTLYPNNAHDSIMCPGCFKEPETKTKEDAYARVVNARLGSLAGEPTEEYLVTLRSQLYSFIGEVDAALVKLYERQARQQEQVEDEHDSRSG
jgi:hypothetical protein